MTGPLTQLKSMATFNDLLNAHKKNILLSMNCHAVATVKQVDLDAMTLQAQINYGSTVYKINADGTTGTETKNYPLLVDVPFIILGGGTTYLTFPIKVGDECLLLFNDRDLNNWIAGASTGPVASNRLHSMADAMALVGFIVPEEYDPDRATLGNGETSVGVGANKIRLKNATESLNTILQDLVTQIKSISTTNTVPGSPAFISAASQAALAAVATRLGALLE